MAEPTIICPHCKKEIKLTESLAAPLIEATRENFEKLIAKKDNDLAEREKELKERLESLAKQRETIEAQVAEKVQQAKSQIAIEEARKAKQLIGTDLEQKSKEISNLQEVLKQRDSKLAEAQNAQVQLIKKQQELDDAKRELELNVGKRVQASLEDVREKAKKEAEEGLKMKVLEKDQTISSMTKQIDDLKRRAEQGSQQLQGEVQELELETLLKAKFPYDNIEPVPKGEYGGDALQRVNSQVGQACGTILWESKRTKNWSDGWLAKLRDDQRTAKAEIAVLITQVLPKDIESFDLREGVWVAHPRLAIPIAMMLRQSLIELGAARQSTEGQQTKAEMLYSYLTSPRFRLRVQAIAEAFSTMKEDLDKEKKVITKQWSKRDEQIERVMQATVGMYGDMQGIAGKTLQQIEGLEFKALEDSVSVKPDAN